MISVATAGEFQAHGYRLDAYCNACRHHRGVDLAPLPEGTLLTGEGRCRLRCTACGSIDVARTVVAPTWWSLRRRPRRQD